MSAADTAFISQLVNSPGWLKYIGDRNIKNKKDALAYIEKIIANPNTHFWTIEEKNSSNQAGIITLIKREGLDHPDFGFALLPEYYKKGIAFEASARFLDIFHNLYKIPRLLAITLKENVSSIQLLEKLGFEFDKDIELNNEPLLLYARSFY